MAKMNKMTKWERVSTIKVLNVRVRVMDFIQTENEKDAKGSS